MSGAKESPPPPPVLTFAKATTDKENNLAVAVNVSSPIFSIFVFKKIGCHFENFFFFQNGNYCCHGNQNFRGTTRYMTNVFDQV